MKFFICFLLSSLSCAFSEGLFMGGHGGATYREHVNKYTSFDKGPVNIAMHGVGGAAGANVGYLASPSGGHLLAGAELYGTMFAGKVSAKLIFSGDVSDGKVEASHIYGVGGAVLAGLWVNPKAAVYGRAGMEFNAFSFKYTFLDGTAKNIKKKILAVVPGMGMLYKVSDTFFVGFEYRQPLFKKIDLVLDVSRKTTVKTTEHQGFIVLRKFF